MCLRLHVFLLFFLLQKAGHIHTLRRPMTITQHQRPHSTFRHHGKSGSSDSARRTPNETSRFRNPETDPNPCQPTFPAECWLRRPGKGPWSGGTTHKRRAAHAIGPHDPTRAPRLCAHMGHRHSAAHPSGVLVVIIRQKIPG